jgi:hypothetical protein
LLHHIGLISASGLPLTSQGASRWKKKRQHRQENASKKDFM